MSYVIARATIAIVPVATIVGIDLSLTACSCRVLLKGYKWEHLEMCYKLRATPYEYPMDTWRLLKSWLGQLCYLKSGGTIGLSLLKDDPALLQAAMDSLKDNIKNVLQNRQKGNGVGCLPHALCIHLQG